MKKFSLIIPVYKHERTIKREIESIITILSVLSVPFEVIPVIDGKLDNSWSEAEKVKDKRVKVVGYETNHGKGYAVRYGFAHATGDVIGFMDGGVANPRSPSLKIRHYYLTPMDPFQRIIPTNFT